MKIPALLLVLTLAASPSFPAEILKFRSEVDGDDLLKFSGTITVDGGRARIDYDVGSHPLLNPATSILSLDGGKVVVVFDHANRTWFERHTRSMSGPLSTYRAPWQKSVGKPVARIRATGMEKTIAGRRARHYHLTWWYDLRMEAAGEKMTARVNVDADIWADPDFSVAALPYGLDFALKTGLRNVDRAVASRVRGIGFPLELRVTARRTIEGGDEMAETVRTTIESIEAAVDDETIFTPPHAYRRREPVLTVPEREGGGGQ